MPPKNQKRDPPPHSSLPPKSTAFSKLSTKSSKNADSAAKSRKSEGSSNNLIDLAQVDDKNSVRVSILQEFDPILSDSQSYYGSYYGRTMSPDQYGKCVFLNFFFQLK